jgi:hypothetical protein
MAGIATGLVATAIIGAVIFLQPSPQAVPPKDLIDHIAAAKVQIAQGSCAEALAQHIDPALARFAGDTDLLALKRQAEGCRTKSVENLGPQPDPNLETAKELIAANDCAGALVKIDDVLSRDPANFEALGLKTQAEACKPVEKVSVTRPLERIPPADGGLDLVPGEREPDYQLRIKEMRARYDNAVITASKGPSRAAISQFEAIAKETPSGYLDVSARLAEATRAWRATAKPLVTEANNLAAKGMWNEALQKFAEARVIDPSLSFDDEIRKIEAEKLAAGQQQCRLGKQAINYNRAQAMEYFRRAVALLPPDDPCYAAAKKYVDGAGN